MPDKSVNKKSYSQINEQLAEIIEWFENSEINIDEALAKYESAMKMIAEMEEQLKTAKNKIKKISTQSK
ncbi:exodeoxyribonuclease VII small subunit [Candidatus Saccharibacteria bacterium]|nr:exodeoxyribonuclease VII small subunit [Candidatus Saccharibacteria bacterium]